MTSEFLEARRQFWVASTSWRKPAGRLVWQTMSFVLFFVLWEIAGRIPLSLAFPPFSDVAQSLVRLTVNGQFARAYGETLPPLVIGILLVAASGVMTGVVMGLFRPAEWLLYPLLVLLQTAPMAALVPLITQFYGVGMAAKVVTIVILSAPIIALNSYKGIVDTNRSLIEMCRSFVGTRWQLIMKIMLPSAAGMIFAGMRLGISSAFVGVVLAELLITPTGVGDIISYSSSRSRYADMYAAIVSIVALATLCLTGIQMLERMLFERERGTVA